MLTLSRRSEPGSPRIGEASDLFRLTDPEKPAPDLFLIQQRRKDQSDTFTRSELLLSGLNPNALVLGGRLLPLFENGPEFPPVDADTAVRQVLEEIGSKDVLRKLEVGFQLLELDASRFPILNRVPSALLPGSKLVENAVLRQLKPVLSPACLPWLVNRFLTGGVESEFASRLLLSDLEAFHGKAASPAAEPMIEALNRTLPRRVNGEEVEPVPFLHPAAARMFLKLLASIRPARTWDLFRAVERWRDHPEEEVRGAAQFAYWRCFVE